MQKHTVFKVVIIMFLALLSQCESETLPPVKLYHEYFPVSIGHYVIYEVDSIVYDDFTGEMNEYYYQVKELVESEFIDGDGNVSFRLERYRRNSEDDEWLIKNVFKSRLDDSKALKTEDNITFIKLIFPPEENKTWEGNAYNNMSSQIYTYKNIHMPFLSDENIFDSTLTITQKDFQTLISVDFQKEVYAKRIGMIYKKFVELVTEVDGTIVRGVDYSYNHIESGTFTIDE